MWWPLPPKSERNPMDESEGGEGQAGPAGLTAGSSVKEILPKVLGPLTEAQSKVVPGCTS